MKTYVLFILITFSVFSGVAQKGVRIGYVDMDYILENVEEYQAANKQLASKVQKWKAEAEDQEQTIQKMWADLNAEKILLTKELIHEREEEIMALESQMKEYQQDRFGPQGDLVRQRIQLVKPIQDQVFNAVQEIAANKKYDFVFDKSADVVMLYSDKRYDISEQILRSINVTRKQGGKKESRNEANSALDEFEEKDPELKAREEAYEEKKETMTNDVEARREAKLKEIEERKKAYEERRQKMLEEREARRKAKLEEREKLKEQNKNSNTTESEEGE